jgi:hypothetical protein
VPRPGPARCAALLALACALAARGARADDLPSGRLAMVAGVRNGSGHLSSDYGLAGVLGFEAAWAPTSTERRVSVGGSVSLLWSRFTIPFTDRGLDDISPTHDLRTVELGTGLRARVLVVRSPVRFATVGAGVCLLRSNVRLPSAEDRSSIGPYVTAGVEVFAARSLMLSMELRYGQIATGPGMTSVLLGVAVGE